MPSSEDSVSVHKYVCKSWTNSLESCWINGIWIQTYTLIQAEQVFILFYSFINSSTIMFDTCVSACSQNTEICFQWLCAHFFCLVCVYVLVIDCMCVFLRLLLEARKEKRASLLSWSLWVNSTVLPDRVFWEGGGVVLPEATGNCTGNLPLTILLFTVIQEIHSPIILLGAACYSQFGLP